MVKNLANGIMVDNFVFVDLDDQVRSWYDQTRFGEVNVHKKLQLSLIEAFYLMEKTRLEILDRRNSVFTFERFLNKAKKLEPQFWIRYCVFKDLRNRGYIVKTALKFGADFRVYDRGVRPGDDHARWVVYPVYEGSSMTWYEFAAKNRVAHSTKKRLMLGVVDDEGEVSYWEVRWLRP